MVKNKKNWKKILNQTIKELDNLIKNEFEKNLIFGILRNQIYTLIFISNAFFNCVIELFIRKKFQKFKNKNHLCGNIYIGGTEKPH